MPCSQGALEEPGRKAWLQSESAPPVLGAVGKQGPRGRGDPRAGTGGDQEDREQGVKLCFHVLENLEASDRACMEPD